MAARNPISPSTDIAFAVDPCLVHSGLVEHRLVSPTVQVQILAIVDATGSASVGTIMAAFPCHEDPVGAIFALIAADVLVLLTSGIIDANSIVARTGRNGPLDENDVAVAQHDGRAAEPAEEAPVSLLDNLPARFSDLVEAAPPASSIPPALPPGLEPVTVCQLQPRIIVGSGDFRTAFGRIACLQRPGVYLLVRGGVVYVGYGEKAGFRIIDGRQLPGGAPDRIIAIVDANDGFTSDDAKAYERILWSSVAAEGYHMENGVPAGAAIDPARYEQLALFNAQVMLALRQAGLMFLGGSTREQLAGPLSEPDSLGAPRGIDEVPEGQLMELNYRGLTAHAARRDDGTWTLLNGSQIRTEVATSATSTATFLRAAWLHAGLLEPAEDGSCYLLKRDMTFPTPGTLGGFVSGGKGGRASAWQPVNGPDDTDGLSPAF